MTTGHEATRAWLQRYQYAKRELKRLKAEREELETYGLHSMRYDTPIGGSSRRDLSDTVAIYESMQEKILKQRYHAIKAMKEVKSVIDRVDNATLRELLSLRYIRGSDWETIAEQLCYDRSYVFRLHNKVLESVAAILDSPTPKNN